MPISSSIPTTSGRSRDPNPLLSQERDFSPSGKFPHSSLPLKVRGTKGVMNRNDITHADFIEHPDDVRTESGP
jgi:hypothetical protein